MSHNSTSNTPRTQANFLLALLTSQHTLTLATLNQDTSTHPSKVITTGSQHLPNSHQLVVYIMPVFHHNNTPLILKCKDLVTKVILSYWFPNLLHTSNFTWGGMKVGLCSNVLHSMLDTSDLQIVVAFLIYLLFPYS